MSDQQHSEAVPQQPSDEALPTGALSDDELSGVASGGLAASAGDWVAVEGGLYQTSYAEYYSGTLRGIYKIERALPGRPAPYLIYPWVGWMKEEAIVVNYGH